MAERVARAACPALITGETGTGKGHLARWIHQHSPRAKSPLIPVNCGAIPENLIDSHLFGHARGSFSGASADHQGLVRAAEGGTILFDEVSELPATAQLRLLRLLEEREVQPVGYSRPITVNVRVIAATNSDLQQAVREGRFREDLYFRLDVVRLHVKPLRERSEDIPRLLSMFNGEFAAMYRQDELGFSPAAMRLLHTHRWPGNVRELRAVVERLHVLCGNSHSRITVEDLATFGQLKSAEADGPRRPAVERLHSARRDTVHDVLRSCKGNMSRAATTLGVHRSTLYRWLSERPVTA